MGIEGHGGKRIDGGLMEEVNQVNFTPSTKYGRFRTKFDGKTDETL